MLVAKFIVPVIRRIHTNIIKYSVQGKQCSKTLCKRPQDVKKETILSKCKKYQEDLAKCPKISKEQRCCKKLFAKPPPKCKERSVVDVYQKAYENVTKQSNAILNNIQNESKSMFVQLTKDIELSKNNEQVLVSGILHDIKKTLQKLLAVDPSFGSMKRKSAMSLNHEVRQAFENVEYDVVPRIKRIKVNIECLERDVLVCIDRAKSLILSCRKCKTPQALAKCIEENAVYAEKILDKTSQNAQTGLDKIESLQRGILEYHKASLTNVSQTCRKKGEAFLEHLNNCVTAAKNEQKRR
ncbi:uncharacterized protein LOC117209318 [Bombus bifarius]|nr:uncharacterized protein LOC117209318 [Bombus bifarius]